MESNVECHIFLEHKGSLVTAMKWNGEELYCGDNKGMLSGIALPKLLVICLLSSFFYSVYLLFYRQKTSLPCLVPF